MKRSRETLACGTGATAVAIAMNAIGLTDASSIVINVEGEARCFIYKEENQFTNVFFNRTYYFRFEGTVII
jgi:diaminopimelate epimerase